MTGCSGRPPRQEAQAVPGAGGLHGHSGQVGIEVQVKPGWLAFQTAQQQALHGIETDGAQPESVLDCMVDLLVGEAFQEPEHLHELTLAPPSLRASSRRRSVANSSGSSHPCSGAAWSRAAVFCSSRGR